MVKGFVLFIMFIFAMTNMAVAEKLLYVKSKYAKLRKRPRRKRRKDKKLKRGTELKRIRYKRKWYKVKYTAPNGKTYKGWIYKGRISKKAPEVDGSLTAGGNPLSGEDVATSRALRGVGPMAKKYASKNKILPIHEKYLDYHHSFIMTNKMETKATLTSKGIEMQKITEEEVAKFMEEGKLGEYAESPEVAEGE